MTTSRLQIFETNYGRQAGIRVLWDGVPVARLEGPRTEEMFWTSYRVEPLPGEPTVDPTSAAFWDDGAIERLTFVSELSGEALPRCFFVPPPGGPVERITLRGDALLPSGRVSPYPWEWIALWWRGVHRRDLDRS